MILPLRGTSKWPRRHPANDINSHSIKQFSFCPLLKNRINPYFAINLFLAFLSFMPLGKKKRLYLQFINTMISSSHFFKKTFFTLQKEDASTSNRNLEYGPWSQQTVNPGEMKTKKYKIAKNRYSLTINQEDQRQRLNKSDMSKSILFPNQNLLIMTTQKDKRHKSSKNKINQENSEKHQSKLPTIKINQSHTDSLKKNMNLPKFEGSYLNFITNNNQKSLKRFISRKEDIAPRFQIYRKCIIAARRMIYDGQHNSLFYNE